MKFSSAESDEAGQSPILKPQVGRHPRALSNSMTKYREPVPENYKSDDVNFHPKQKTWPRMHGIRDSGSQNNSTWDFPRTPEDENFIVPHMNFTIRTVWDTQDKNQNELGEGQADSVGINFKNQNDRGSMMNSRQTPESNTGSYIFLYNLNFNKLSFCDGGKFISDHTSYDSRIAYWQHSNTENINKLEIGPREQNFQNSDFNKGENEIADDTEKINSRFSDTDSHKIDFTAFIFHIDHPLALG